MSKISTLIRYTTASALMSAAVVATPSSAVALDDAQFEKLMATYLNKESNLEQVGGALEKYFRKKREDQQQRAAQDEEKRVEDQFKNPIKIEIGSSPVKGKKDAPITVVEFSDFQCPFCKRGMTVMDDLLKEYPNDVKIVFKNLPLPFHPEAKPAAAAALAAGAQGKYWEYHDLLFNNQDSLSTETYIKLAGDLKLDVEKFKTDMKSEKFEKQIADDMAIATQLGVRGTPGFFVNGVQVRGARPLPYFKNLVDRWKKELGK
jgi:protein-disulfide isomerase